jgi:hypothetical protein
MRVPPSSVALIIPTHTPRYLDIVLAGVARQTRKPEHVVVSSDVDDQAVGDVIESSARDFDLTISWVRRAHHGEARLCQVRNNAVRHLIGDLGVKETRLVVIDGDTIPSDTLIEQHHTLGAYTDILCPYRVDLTPERSAEITAEAILEGEQTLQPAPEDWSALRKRDRRCRRQERLKRLGLTERHKPKMLGGHFSVPLALYRRLNGMDEEYTGWGLEDDDFSARADKVGATRRIAVLDIMAYHLWHESRSTGRVKDLPNAKRFHRRHAPVRCIHGLDTPLPQNPVDCTILTPQGPAQGGVATIKSRRPATTHP